MIIGIGSDIVDMGRIARDLERHGSRFVDRVFGAEEKALADSRPGDQRVATYAKRFAAKEACVKALGIGFRKGLTLKDIEVTNDEYGRPSLVLKGVAAERLKAMTPPGQSVHTHVSLTDDHILAQAFVVIETI